MNRVMRLTVWSLVGGLCVAGASSPAWADMTGTAMETKTLPQVQREYSGTKPVVAMLKHQEAAPRASGEGLWKAIELPFKGLGALLTKGKQFVSEGLKATEQPRSFPRYRKTFSEVQREESGTKPVVAIQKYQRYHRTSKP